MADDVEKKRIGVGDKDIVKKVGVVRGLFHPAEGFGEGLVGMNVDQLVLVQPLRIDPVSVDQEVVLAEPGAAGPQVQGVGDRDRLDAKAVREHQVLRRSHGSDDAETSPNSGSWRLSRQRWR